MAAGKFYVSYGRISEPGIVRKQRKFEGYEMLAKAAAAGSLKAQLYINDTIQDLSKKLPFIKQAAQQGVAKAQYELGEWYYLRSQKDTLEGIKWIKCANANNDIEAKYLLASCYLKGRYVPKNIDSAIVMFKQCAEVGDLDSKLVLGNIYSFEEFAKLDFDEALYWYHQFEKGVGGNFSDDNLNERIAHIYLKKNKPDKAIEYFKKAYQQVIDYNQAYSRYDGRIELELDKIYLAKNRFQQAMIWLKRSSAAPNQEARKILKELGKLP